MKLIHKYVISKNHSNLKISPFKTYFLQLENMIKKIAAALLLLIALYGISIFLFPSIPEKIDAVLGIDGFSEKLRTGKEDFDTIVTDIPEINEFKSGAVDIKNTVVE